MKSVDGKEIVEKEYVEYEGEGKGEGEGEGDGEGVPSLHLVSGRSNVNK